MLAWLKARSRWQWVAIAGFAAVVAWMALHPEMRADHGDIVPGILPQVQKSGFAPAHSVRSMRYELTRTVMGERSEMVRRIDILPPESGVSERRSRTYQRQNETSAVEQSLGLTVGPIDLVGYSRFNVPFISDLLPYHIWGKRQLVRFDATVTNEFPHSAGGSLRAAITYRGNDASGEPQGDYAGTLDCDVGEVLEAAQVYAGLTGSAARVTCTEKISGGTRSISTIRRGWFVFTRNLWVAESRSEMLGSGEFALSIEEKFRLKELR